MWVECSVGVPKGYEVNEEILALAQEKAKQSGALIEQVHDAIAAVKNADIIYTDVWTSMGWEDEATERMEMFADYQVTAALVADAKNDYSCFNSLPAIRGAEVNATIIAGPHSVMFDEAENRLHAQKAILPSII